MWPGMEEVFSTTCWMNFRDLFFKAFPTTPWHKDHYSIYLSGKLQALVEKRISPRSVCFLDQQSEPLGCGVLLCPSLFWSLWGRDPLYRVCEHTRDGWGMWHPPTWFPRASSSPSQAAYSHSEPCGHSDRGDKGTGAENRGSKDRSSGAGLQGLIGVNSRQDFPPLEQPSGCKALLQSSQRAWDKGRPRILILISLRRKMSSNWLTHLLPATQWVEEPKFSKVVVMVVLSILLRCTLLPPGHSQKISRPSLCSSACSTATRFRARIWHVIVLAFCTFSFVFRMR